MMNKFQKTVINIIKCALAGRELDESDLAVISENRNEVIGFAEKQGVLPFFKYFRIFTENGELFHKFAYYVYRDVNQSEGLKEMTEAFEKNGIYCAPLKGSLTKHFYPDSDVRTLGDIDILYKKEQTALLISVMEQLGYEYEGYAAKHEHYRRNGYIVEMHKELLTEQSPAIGYFNDIWSRMTPEDGKEYVYRMNAEDHYLLTVFHLLEHFIRDGIGLRMVLDIYILTEKCKLDFDYIGGVLKELKLDSFEKDIRALAHFWFSPENTSEIADRELEDYVLSGGVYGCNDNNTQNAAVIFNSGRRYLLNAIFPSYRIMCSVIPWLHTPILLPLAWISRWVSVLFHRRQNIKLRFGIADGIDRMNSDEVENRTAFFARWGLKPFNSYSKKQ